MASSSLFSRLRIPHSSSSLLRLRHASSSSGRRVGFIGLGNMGNSMATNLLKKGHSLVVFDIQPTASTNLVAMGAKVASSPAEVASQVDTVVTMLPASPHVRGVYEGPHGILKAAKAGVTFVDSSTIDPDTSKAMAALASANSQTYLDCPVSGGVGGASAGTLTFMVGGAKEAVASVEPLLLGMGSRVVHCGGVGMGGAAKICNNMLLGISMVGVAETLNLGVRQGLDAALLSSIINSSTGRCWSSEVYNPVPHVTPSAPSCNHYKGGFGSALIAKDLGLAQSAAGGSGSPTPLGALAHQIYTLMCARGYAHLDFSSVFQFLQQQQTNEKE